MTLRASVVASILEVDAGEWNACARGRPFLQHAFFAALERSGTVGPNRGVVPEYLMLRDPDGRLLACAPAMLKTGTLAEYGPEHRWLKSGLARGCFAWPKYQCGVPLYPIRGPKLLLHPDAPRVRMESALVRALEDLAGRKHRTAALNVMQLDESQARAFRRNGWLLSSEQHAFWHNPGHASFDGYLAALPHRKRYMILKERRETLALGLEVRTLSGDQITTALLASYYAGHVAVCRRHGNRPWLPPALYDELVARMPQSVRMIAAFDGDAFVAGVFCLVDHDTLYLRTWSTLRELPTLCFELICYRPFIHAIEHGLAMVDSGLSGPHKRQRGYVDEPVFSAHWFLDPRLGALARETLAAGVASAIRGRGTEAKGDRDAAAVRDDRRSDAADGFQPDDAAT